jgi:Myb-like DNA-binding domain
LLYCAISAWHDMHPLLELKTWPRVRPVSKRLSMHTRRYKTLARKAFQGRLLVAEVKKFYNLDHRRIAQLIGGGSLQDLVKSEGPDALWTDDEIEVLKTCLRLSGRNWSLMAEKLSSKSSDQCKKFFYENRKKFQLDKLVLEYKRVGILEIVFLFITECSEGRIEKERRRGRETD